MKNRNKSTASFKRKFTFWWNNLSTVLKILIVYVIMTFSGTFLLMLPISSKIGHINFLDALFTSASAFSDTGLVTMTTSETWTIFGQGIIAILILIGGIGFFALKVYIVNVIILRNWLSLSQRETLAAERGSVKVGVSKNLIRRAVSFILLMIVIFSFILTLYFYFAKTDYQWAIDNGHAEIGYMTEIPKGDFGVASRWGIFHTISAINNAGFDIMGQNSLLGYYRDTFVQVSFLVLFIAGGLGYPVLYDFTKWIQAKIRGERFSFSFFTKLSTASYLSIALCGLILTFTTEGISSNGFWKDNSYGSYGNKTMALIFNTMSTRNAGFATFDLNDLRDSSLIIYSIMMFIGSSPSSTAGGIRTTTIAIIFLTVWKNIIGRERGRAFNRRISHSTTIESFVVFTMATMLIMGSFIIGATTFLDGADDNLIKIFFEINSAFGTTGLSLGITSQLSIIAKINLIILMFIGQLGVSTSMLVWNGGVKKKKTYSLLETDVTIG